MKWYMETMVQKDKDLETKKHGTLITRTLKSHSLKLEKSLCIRAETNIRIFV